MTSLDWKIQKRLLDAGGLGPIIYILPARGNGKLARDRERISELLSSGRTVVYGRPKRSIFVDKDILTPERYEQTDRILNELLKGEKMMNRLNNWTIEGNTVRLSYDNGELYVTKEDFDRAFGPIVSATYDDVKRDFAIS